MSEIAPLLPRLTPELERKTIDLLTSSAHLQSKVHPAVLPEIKELLINVNSYYSNLIEGYFTYLVDIERSLQNHNLKSSKDKFTLELHQAHVKTEKYLQITSNNPFSEATIKLVHREFYSQLNDENALWVFSSDKSKKMKMIPGEFRQVDVQVGTHVAPSFLEIPKLMAFFEKGYTYIEQPLSRIMAIAAAHHRFSYIHPFADGNGRVNRLLTTYALSKEMNDTSLLWSVSRGFARKRDDYYSHLSNADSFRVNDFDGRGPLSERYLVEFIHYFLNTCLDQVHFMSELLRLDTLAKRVYLYFNHLENGLIPHVKIRDEAAFIINHILAFGEISRGEVSRISGLGDRTARTLTSEMVSAGFLTSSSHKSSLKLKIPFRVVPFWFPDLYSGQPSL